MLTHKGVDHQMPAVWTYGSVEVYFQYYAYKAPFNDEEKRMELLARLTEIPDVSLPEDSITKRPSIQLATLATGDNLQQLYG